jgi:phage shock protein PspC (stress-responsive transcriptional regulator)
MMDKTININMGGTLFKLEEDAFRILRDYIQAINNRFRNVQGGLETIEDIESRIAEIFQSQRGLAGVISKENVEAMIGIIGKPEDFDLNEDETIPPVYPSQKRRLYRNPDDSIISGVCGGLGAYLNTDPVLFRILFVISAMVFGAGFFVYLVLWIALPQARNDSQKRELYGNAYHSARSRNIKPYINYETGSSGYSSGDKRQSGVSNALNDIFRAIGRVLYFVLRIFLIIIGVLFVLTGFLIILSFVMVFVFKYPGAFSTDAFDVSLVYFPDFLNYIVNPAITPWIVALSVIALILPMLALIYWGVKMIFFFRARDGVFSLTGLVIWVMSITALAIILFNEGISFAETARSSTDEILTSTPDTLYILSAHRVSDLKVDKELSIKKEGYTVLINEEAKELYIRPYLSIISSNGEDARIEVRKRSSGRSELDAQRKAESIPYNYTLNRNKLFLDEYFTITSKRKWSADNVGINVFVPEGTILKFDSGTVSLFHDQHIKKYEDHNEFKIGSSGNSIYILTEDGIKPAGKY